MPLIVPMEGLYVFPPAEDCFLNDSGNATGSAEGVGLEDNEFWRNLADGEVLLGPARATPAADGTGVSYWAVTFRELSGCGSCARSEEGE